MKQNRVNKIWIASKLSRRKMLLLTGAATVSFMAGRVWGQSAALPSCIVRPQQTEGPYFADEKLNRSDIRADPSDGSVKEGVPLHLALRVSRMEGNTCTPLSGAIVNVWQCDALGVYSDFQDINGLFDTRGEKFLRGYQVTDANGKAEFITIYPGWYPGRTVHVHFKLRTDSAAQRSYEFTSQIYFDESTTDQVHAQLPYAAKGQRTLRNEDDSIFQRGGNKLILQLTKNATGYAGIFDIGLQMA